LRIEARQIHRRPAAAKSGFTRSSILDPQSWIIAALATMMLAGCGTFGARAPDTASAPGKPTPAGGYYLNDGPGDNPPPNLDQIPDTVPRREALARGALRPYTVMGVNYTPMTQLAPYKARGMASWYGRRYHGQKTSSGEIYDMYGMSAAHTVLPIPSYARVTNLVNNKSVVVRVNDRGPFHSDRLIDLSYTAAYKLGVLGGGKALVEVEAIIPDGGTPAAPAVVAAPPPAVPTRPGATIAVLPPLVPPVAIPLPPDPEPAAQVIAPPDPPAAAPVVAVSAEQKGLYLQLGAFGSQDNADNYLARLKMQVDWLAPALHVFPKDGLFRVHAGPYVNQSDARAAADRISQALGVKAMVLVR
jgi:rare lipoprotein A